MSQQQKLSKVKKVKIAYSKVFSSEEGKTVLYDLMDTCNFMGSSVLDSQSYEPIGMAMRDGQKQIISRILSEISISPDQFIKLLEEKYSEEQEDFNL